MKTYDRIAANDSEALPMADTSTPASIKSLSAYMASIRRAVQGSNAVKSSGYTDLPHPSQLDQNSDEQICRYKEYIASAEFMEFPSQTLANMLGKLNLSKMPVELPSAKYLEANVDGNGLSLAEAMEISASEVLQVKWQILVAEYKGLQGIKPEQLSAAETAELKPRASVKTYNRESVIDYHYGMVNGVMQLEYLALCQDGYKFNTVTYEREKVKSTLILALDAAGNYYQKKIVDEVESAPFYVTIDNKPVKFIPAVVVSDQTIQSKLPTRFGFLAPICDLAFARYIMSANYKEALRNLPPTTYISGGKKGDDALFEKLNGRKRILTGAGAVNVLPNGYTVEIKGTDGSLEAYETYFDKNERQVRAIGGVYKSDDSGERTAAETKDDAGERTAKLIILADSLEASWSLVLSYCAMYEGDVAQDGVAEYAAKIDLSIGRDFSSVKLSVDEAKELRSQYIEGVITRDRAITELEAGGWYSSDASDMIEEINAAPPTITEP